MGCLQERRRKALYLYPIPLATHWCPLSTTVHLGCYENPALLLPSRSGLRFSCALVHLLPGVEPPLPADGRADGAAMRAPRAVAE
eukprot:6176614-Pleurochrysis_carterae.AAC.3